MKACDIQGIKVLDKVFLAEPVDTFYRARREHGTIVALACHEPEESCFCKVFGVDCAEPDADVVMWNANDTLYWKAVTDKGTALTEDALRRARKCRRSGRKGRGDRTGEHPRNRREAAVHEPLSRGLERQRLRRKKIQLPPFGRSFISRALRAAPATFVCPTCQCYDIKDYDTGHGIQRYRCWDSLHVLRLYDDGARQQQNEPDAALPSALHA